MRTETNTPHTVRGTVCGIIAAVSYGTNPLGALNLYAAGMNPNSVLFYRYGIAAVLLAAYMIVLRKSFRVTLKELTILTALGVIFAISSLSLYCSFNFMDAGIASTLLFVYPVMVAVMMAVFFHERVTASTVLSIVLALMGIALLYRGDDGATLNTVGVLLVMVSSLSYAVYIIIVNKSPLRMSTVKLTFYVLLTGTLTIVVYSLFSPEARLMPLTTPDTWFYALLLALFPTVISLVMMTIAVHDVGSTPTAIMGALEPITAVIIGVTMFGEAFTSRLASGILLILFAVILIIMGKQLSPRRITYVVSHLGHVLKKTWRWKS